MLTLTFLFTCASESGVVASVQGTKGMDISVKRVYRSRTDRQIAGVCGGLGHYFDVDPVIVRLVWALLCFAGGLGIPLYIVAAIIIPLEPL